MTESEAYITKLNSNFFFKEFTYSSNKFKIDEKGQELELADNVVWLDDLLLITQIKERNKSGDSNAENWFKSKVLRKAVKQIKDTISYFEIYENISIPNERGHVLNLSEAGKLKPIKIVIYLPGDSFPDSLRFQKFYESRDVGLIHLFHIEDYLWICKYLITPYEIKEFLQFREAMFKFNGESLNNLPEQYVLGHYIESYENFTINPKYIKNLSKYVDDFDSFNISPIIENFKRVILQSTGETDYYYIIKELAKLNRSDLRGFRQRFDLALKRAKDQEFDIPYRMTSLNSQCGFVFIPIEFARKEKWKNGLQNFTLFHKYEQKLDKAVGMICYFDPNEKYHDIFWTYINYKWEYEEELERIIKNDFPLRSVKEEKTYRYYKKE
jgi:hypothetical protein